MRTKINYLPEFQELENNSPKRPEKCHVEEIITNNFFIKVAVKCGCGKHHPIMGKVKKWVQWVILLEGKDLTALENGNTSYAVSAAKAVLW
ncbi:MAG TPA: hypothetical protein VMR49_00455 [Candidatus Paceibacterota bacterium]|jgi:hypothetical protein|nr:hypothetical protein [Candidatus Paceibacterota bacterium]